MVAVMLRSHRKSEIPVVPGARYAIVASLYNTEYVDGMVHAAQAVLESATPSAVELVRVPGSFEIPMAAAALARRTTKRPDAILCLGVIWQGATNHADQIGGAVTRALMDLAMETGIPVIHEVLTVKNARQARERTLDPETNRGAEAASTAIDMVAVLHGIRKPTRR
jgi:6,7-dimethyl-8-ribityllumazine synthase